MSAWAIATALVAVALLTLTALAQLPNNRVGEWIKVRDVISFIPSWTFFAPTPGTTDTRIVWRDRYGDGTVSPWHELDAPRTRLLRVVWQPEKRLRKGLSDCASILRSHIAMNPQSQVPRVSLPFVMLVNYLSHHAPSPISVARQFAVFECQEPLDVGAREQITLELVSHWFRLPGVPPTFEMAVVGEVGAPPPSGEAEA